MGVTDGPGLNPDQLTAPPAGRPPAVHRRPRLLAVIFVGGSVGTLARTVLEDAFPTQAGSMPWTTLAINVTGALLLGLLLEVLTRTGPDSGWRHTTRLGVGTGVLGGFTTYSTFAVETVGRLTPHTLVVGLAYPAACVVLGVTGAAVGYRIAHHLRPRRRAGQEDR